MRMSLDAPFSPPSRHPTPAQLALLGVLVLGLLAPGCAKAVMPPSGAITSPTGIRTGQTPTGTASSATRSAPRSPPPPPRPHALVAVTTAGNLQSLDPSTGHAVTSLAPDATGDEGSLTPDLAPVYYENNAGCFHQILSVPIGGGTPTLVA